MRTITICGSISHLKELIASKNILTGLGYKVELPYKTENYLESNDLKETETVNKKNWYINKHLAKIKSADAILIINEKKNGVDNYIGGNTFLEMGFAYVLGKPIFIKNGIPEIQYKDEILGLMPLVLNGDLSKIEL